MERKTIIMNVVVAVLALAIAFVVGYGVGNLDRNNAEEAQETAAWQKEMEARESFEEDFRADAEWRVDRIDYLSGTLMGCDAVIRIVATETDMDSETYGLTWDLIYTGMSHADNDKVYCMGETFLNTYEVENFAQRAYDTGYFDE